MVNAAAEWQAAVLGY